MAASHFASQLRKDLSIEMIRTKIAEESFLSQKADRYDKYERKRHSGLTDVNLPTLEGRNLELEETSQEPIPEEMSVRQSKKLWQQMLPQGQSSTSKKKKKLTRRMEF
uniref:Uncharacterized protein n=1 Tax=Equus asinus TaxID=9793 RepID=A0A9L0IXW1_EQUAS